MIPDDSNTPPRVLPITWSRRGFVATLLATGALAACGGGSDDGAGSPDDGASSNATGTAGGGTGATSSGSAPADGYTVVQRFPQAVQGPGNLRLPVSLSTGTAALVQDGPANLTAQVYDADGAAIGDPIEAVRRDAVPAPYYDFRATIDTPGFYVLNVEGGTPDGATFDVADPATLEIPAAGDTLAPFDTPTTDDARGVDPICTREPEACAFHDITLTEALARGKHVVYYVGTPAFCSTGSCAPGLESLIEVEADYADTHVFVHAEVYTDTTATTVAPAVEALNLFYEPVLFITDPAGVIVERIDAVWNTDELVEALDRSIS